MDAIPAELAEADLTGRDRIYAFADLLRKERDESDEPQERYETWVAFGLADLALALPVSQVREVLRVGRITRVPQAPPPVRGVTNLRGRVLAVVDLGTRSGGRAVEIGDNSRILVVESQGRSLGLLVDRVDKVLDLGMGQVADAPDEVPEGLREGAAGAHPAAGGLLLLDVDKLLLPKIAD